MTNTGKNELVYLNAFNRISVIGAKRIAVLLKHYGSAKTAWEAPSSEISKLLNLDQDKDRFGVERAQFDPDREWALLQKNGISCMAPGSTEYPSLLNELHFPPPLLYYRGSLEMINRPAVAMVGSRRCTFYGQEVARRLAAELVAAGVSVISGMALGIDTAAHQGALENNGYTAAVLGCGLDRCYPSGNKDLMNRIIADGVVLSEFSLGTEPLPSHFPQRNRIISGLSLGTVVIEATAKSGAIITANYALEQNREVFAVPGNVGSPYSRGCHRLIKEGARLVESAADILEELYLYRSDGEQMTIEIANTNLTEGEKGLLDKIPYQPIHIDSVIQISGLGAAEASARLLSLELKKVIRQTPGKFFCRI